MILNLAWFIFPVAVFVSCLITPALLLEIQAFQPAVVPIRAATTLTLQTDTALNVTVNSSLQCRFKDVSVPARMEDGFVFCDTPPMRNIDKVSLYLDVDGKLFKTKKPLYFHEPFKVSNITPSVVSPAQNVHLTVNRITCQEWMQYFVRFQTANGTKKTQQGICKDSVVTCFVPEFPPSTRLRVGLTLSNRLVEWADKKIVIQYPVDALRSSVSDVEIDTSKKGAFTFRVTLKDRFENPITINEREKGKLSKISVQYSTQKKPKLLRFLKCSTTLETNSIGSAYLLGCTGAEGEDIFFFPSINNVPLGGQEKYEAQTTLCPGKSSCIAPDTESFPVVIVAAVSGAVVLFVLLLVVTVFVVCRYGKYKVEKKRRETLGSSNDLEMEIQPPKNFTGVGSEYTHEEMVHQEENCAFVYDEGETPQAADGERNSNIQREPEEDNSHVNSGGSLRVEGAAERDDREGQLTVNIQMAELEVKNPILANLNTVQEIIDRLYRYALVTDERNPGTKQGTKKRQTDLLKRMHKIIQETEFFCKKKETTAALQKAKETSSRLLSLSSQGRQTEGHVNKLSLIEELQENVADLKKALEREKLTTF